MGGTMRWAELRMCRFWAGGISSFPFSRAREYRLLRRLVVTCIGGLLSHCVGIPNCDSTLSRAGMRASAEVDRSGYLEYRHWTTRRYSHVGPLGPWRTVASTSHGSPGSTVGFSGSCCGVFTVIV
jgi:hypothetical protein